MIFKPRKRQIAAKAYSQAPPKPQVQEEQKQPSAPRFLQKEKMEKIDCTLTERVDMNFLKNQITDASISGSIELKVKAKGISKVRNFLVDVDDPRWS